MARSGHRPLQCLQSLQSRRSLLHLPGKYRGTSLIRKRRPLGPYSRAYMVVLGGGGGYL